MYLSTATISEEYCNDFKEYPQDLADILNENGGEEKVLAEHTVQRYLNNLKVSMLL